MTHDGHTISENRLKSLALWVTFQSGGGYFRAHFRFCGHFRESDDKSESDNPQIEK